MVYAGLMDVNRQRSVTGFRPVLVAHGNPPQGSNVYRHLNFIGGAALVGQGRQAFEGMLVKDTLDAWRGSNSGQTVSEVAGDVLGLAVGQELVGAAFTNDFNGARLRIQRMICQ